MAHFIFGMSSQGTKDAEVSDSDSVSLPSKEDVEEEQDEKSIHSGSSEEDDSKDSSFSGPMKKDKSANIEEVVLEELDDIAQPMKKKARTYEEDVKAYWSQYVNPNIWTSMPVFLAIGFGFWALGFIPDYSKCMLTQSIFAIIGGVILGQIPFFQRLVHHPRVYEGCAFSKTMFMRLSVIFYGFKVKLHDIAVVGTGGAISSVLMVVISFAFGILIGWLLKVHPGQRGVLSCGFSICGIAAAMSAGPLFDSSSEQISLTCVLVIVGGFIDIAVYPALYGIRAKLGFDEKNFGVTCGLSIKEIAHTVSVGLSCSPEVSKYSMIVKLFKVLLLPFLLIALAFIMPAIEKYKERNDPDKELRDVSSEEEDVEQKSRRQKCSEFWSRITIPYFAIIFIIMAVINSYVDFSETAHKAFDEIIIIALSTSMFAVGITTDLRNLARYSGWRDILFGIILYIWIFCFGWLLDFAFHRI